MRLQHYSYEKGDEIKQKQVSLLKHMPPKKSEIRFQDMLFFAYGLFCGGFTKNARMLDNFHLYVSGYKISFQYVDRW